MKILVIDDTPTETLLIQNLLTDAGFQSLASNNGQDAERIAENELPDLVLLDIVMPVQDGFKTCRSLKKNPKTQHIPVVMISSKNQDSDKFWAMQQGAKGYITKPYTKETLLTEVRRHLP